MKLRPLTARVRSRYLIRPLRGVIRGVRNSVDQLLYSYRRDSALARLRLLAGPTEILFVCYGNICRSPYAEASLVLRTEQTGVRIESAGFVGPGRSPPPVALAAAEERGVRHGQSVSQLVTPDMVRNADLIFVFDPDHEVRLRRLAAQPNLPTVLLGDLDPRWSGHRAIEDPWGMPIERFRRTFDRIDRCLDVVAGTIA